MPFGGSPRIEESESSCLQVDLKSTLGVPQVNLPSRSDLRLMQ
jgi:hypothetical protein